MVCLQDRTLTAVLKAHRWTIKADLVADLRRALAVALDRMRDPPGCSDVPIARPSDGFV